MNGLAYERRLLDAAALIGLPLQGRDCERLLAYLGLLGRWNETYNLTAIRQPSDQLVQHIFDILAVIPHLERLLTKAPNAVPAPEQPELTPSGASIANPTKTPLQRTTPALAVTPGGAHLQPISDEKPHAEGPQTGATQQVWDVGSGAGIPGLLLAILWPLRRITTIDSVGKKIAFQQHVIAELGLKNATAIHGRVEQQKPTFKPDLIICRAFTSLAQFIDSTRSVAGANTVLAAMKGKLPQSEIQQIPPTWQVSNIQPVQVPELEAERHLIILNRN